MKKVILLLTLLAFSVTFSASAGNLKGDVDGDGNVGISDVTALIDYILGNGAYGIDMGQADVNGDGNLGIADVTDLIDIILKGTMGDDDEHQWVDLGLPSGTLWATTNIGADNPEEFGDYLSWGEIRPKGAYEWNNYKWCAGSYNTMTKYCTVPEYGAGGFVDNLTTLDPADDAATVRWGSSWRMPTHKQQKELLDCCQWTETDINGVHGYEVTGSNGTAMFFPAAGYREGSEIKGVGALGLYWSNSLYSSIPADAFDLELSSTGNRWYFLERYFGLTVRAVYVP